MENFYKKIMETVCFSETLAPTYTELQPKVTPSSKQKLVKSCIGGPSTEFYDSCS
jgi:hypothetical protein